MKPLSVDDRAEAEIANALNRSGRRRTEFRRRIDAALAAIQSNPAVGPRIGRSRMRRYIMGYRFPYSLIYADESDVIRVYAFPHHKQRPGYWLPRTRRRP